MRKSSLTRSPFEDIFLIILLLFSPLALAGVQTWAYCVIAILSLVIFNIRFLNNIDALRKVMILPVSFGVVLFLGVACLYLVPMPAKIIKLVSPAAFNLKEKYMLDPVLWQTFSVYSRATVSYIIKVASYVMVFLVVVSRIRSSSGEKVDQKSEYRDEASGVFLLLGALTSILSILFHSFFDFNLHIPANALYFTVVLAIVAGLAGRQRGINYSFLSKFVNSIIVIGFVVAVFSIVQKFSYNDKIYWIFSMNGSHFGPYVNHDHYAGYMGMCIFMAVAQFVSKISNSSFPYIKRLKDRIIWFSSSEANEVIIYLFVAIVMTASLFMTTSRGGILSFSAAFLVFYFVCIICAKKRKRMRLLLAVILMLLLMCVMIIWVGPEKTIEKFKGLDALLKSIIEEGPILSTGDRLYFWKDTLGLIKYFPITGSGLGTFYCVFPNYRTFPDDWGFLRYAHNDYFQFISGMGIIGLAYIIAFFIWYIRRFKECMRRMRDLA